MRHARIATQITFVMDRTVTVEIDIKLFAAEKATKIKLPELTKINKSFT